MYENTKNPIHHAKLQDNWVINQVWKAVALITQHDEACIFATGVNFAKLANLARLANLASVQFR